MQHIVETTIHHLNHDGRGVTCVAGKTVFVSGALPDERARIRIYKRHHHYDEAEIVELLESSPHRIQAKCPHAGQCGGCSLQHLETGAQIRMKEQVLAENLIRIGKVTPQTWLRALTCKPWAYRRRGRLSVRLVAKKGRVLVGFREAAKPRFVADITRCEVIHPLLGDRIPQLATLIGNMDDASTIPQIEFSAGDEVVALLFRHMQALSARDQALLIAFGKQHGFAIYLQPAGVGSVHPLWPENPSLSFCLSAGPVAQTVELAFHPLDFVQVNALMNQKMLLQVMALLDLKASDRVLDLFCGLGNFTLPMARKVSNVTGIEGDEALLARATDNAQKNKITSAHFYQADLFEDQRGNFWARQPWDKLLLDPPRAGADKVLAYLPHKETRRVVYVSCNPASLARDAGILVGCHGFVLTSAGVMDMFPHTTHVESVALFER